MHGSLPYRCALHGSGRREAFRRESRLKESKEVDIGGSKVAMLLGPTMD